MSQRKSTGDQKQTGHSETERGLQGKFTLPKAAALALDLEIGVLLLSLKAQTQMKKNTEKKTHNTIAAKHVTENVL